MMMMTMMTVILERTFAKKSDNVTIMQTTNLLQKPDLYMSQRKVNVCDCLLFIWS